MKMLRHSFMVLCKCKKNMLKQLTNNMTTNLLMCKITDDHWRDEAAHGCEKVCYAEDARRKVWCQILSVLTTSDCCSSVETKWEGDERDTNVRVLIHKAEAKQKQSWNDVSWKKAFKRKLRKLIEEILQKMQKVFRTCVGLTPFLVRLSPMSPNMKPDIILAMYGMLDMSPECFKSNLRTWLMNIGAEVRRKKTPQTSLKCRKRNAKNGLDRIIITTGGRSWLFEMTCSSESSMNSRSEIVISLCLSGESATTWNHTIETTNDKNAVTYKAHCQLNISVISPIKGHVIAAPSLAPSRLDTNIPFSDVGAQREMRLWHVEKKNPWKMHQWKLSELRNIFKFFLRHKCQAPDAHKTNIGSFHLL